MTSIMARWQSLAPLVAEPVRIRCHMAGLTRLDAVSR